MALKIIQRFKLNKNHTMTLYIRQNCNKQSPYFVSERNYNTIRSILVV